MEEELDLPKYEEVVKCHCGEPAVGQCPCCGHGVCGEHMEQAAHDLAKAVGLPSMQNIPVRTEGGKRIRDAFAGKQIPLSADYSQVERRILRQLEKQEDPK